MMTFLVASGAFLFGMLVGYALCFNRRVPEAALEELLNLRRENLEWKRMGRTRP